MTTSIAAIQDFGKQYCKVDIIRGAYSQMRISGLTVQPTPEDLEVALMRLENMVAEWGVKNVLIDYNFEDIPDPNSLTNVNSGYANALETNLAIRLIPDFNKEVPAILYNLASGSYSTLSGAVALQRLNQVRYPRRQPVGSGNSLRWNRWSRFYRVQNNELPNVNKAEKMFLNDINDYVERFDAYLDELEEIDTFNIQVDGGLELISSSLEDTNKEIKYRIKAANPVDQYNNYISQVTIVVSTTKGRVDTRRIFFRIERADRSC